VVYEMDGLQAMFHGDTMSASGRYTALVPEPGTLMTLLLGLSGLVFPRATVRGRDA